MDTVTESRMVIAMARAGGKLHHNSAFVTEQAGQVDGEAIRRPAWSPIPSMAGQHLWPRSMRQAPGSDLRLVVDDDGVLVGIITNRDVRFEVDQSKQVAEVMTKAPLITAWPVRPRRWACCAATRSRSCPWSTAAAG